VESLIERTARKLNVEASTTRLMDLKPVERLDEGILATEKEACAELGIEAELLPSGAIHDAAVVANRRRSDGSGLPVGMIFIPCLGGVSHNPAEFAQAEDLVRGAQVLGGTLRRLASM
jgi:acetylornithine deacetylase/succinyl-diaminopimelate desuccinylase-like protein